MYNRRPWARLVWSVTLLVIFPSCVSYRAEPAVILADGRPRTIRVTLDDRSRAMLNAATLVNDTIVSTRQLPDRSRSRFLEQLPLQDARLIEVRRLDVGRSALLFLGVSAALVAAIGIAAAITLTGMTMTL